MALRYWYDDTANDIVRNSRKYFSTPVSNFRPNCSCIPAPAIMRASSFPLLFGAVPPCFTCCSFGPILPTDGMTLLPLQLLVIPKYFFLQLPDIVETLASG
jgi:hypothetical protein